MLNREKLDKLMGILGDLTDACYAFSVAYYNRKDCSKAWK